MSTESLNTNAYIDVYEQYVEEASFLWGLRSAAVKHPHYRLTDIAVLERRIQAHLDGLMTAPAIAWRVCEQALQESNGPGEVFAASVIAFQSHDPLKIRCVAEIALESTNAVNGLISAMAWLPPEIGGPWLGRFLDSKNPGHNYLAIAACSLLRKDPGDHLARFLHHHDMLKHDRLQARCLRLVGELKRHDLVPALNQGLAAGNEDVAFWAKWSAILLGDGALATSMEPHIFHDSPHRDRALDIAFRVLPLDDARTWISRLASDPKHFRSAVKAAGILGDPRAISWLIRQMEDPAHARLAGEAFTMITGIDLDRHDLSRSPPDDDEDDDAGLAEDQDENLPWPDAQRIKAYWETGNENYAPGVRHLLGHPVNPEFLKQNMDRVFQRQRHAISMEIALIGQDEAVANSKGKII